MSKNEFSAEKNKAATFSVNWRDAASMGKSPRSKMTPISMESNLEVYDVLSKKTGDKGQFDL